MTENQRYIGVDLGGTKILTALVDGNGRILAQDYRRTKAKRGQAEVVQRIVDSVRQVLADSALGPDEILGLGVGAPGPVDVAAGLVTMPPNLPGWVNVPLQSLLQGELGIPTFLENDANAAALGEYRFGAGRGSHNMLYITVSTGIGGGFILDGKLYRGSSGAAAEVGHMTVLPRGPHCGCGNRGCLEAVASGTAIAREGRELLLRQAPTLITELANSDPEQVSAKLVADAARAGDVEAQEIIREAMHYLGVGVSSLVNLLNPELIVIGGSLTKLQDTLFGPVRREIIRRSFPTAAQRVRVVPAELGDQVGVLGAAAVAIEACAAAVTRES